MKRNIFAQNPDGQSGLLQDKSLLVVSHRYNHFTKEQIDEISEFVDEVHVYARYNRFTDLSRFLDWEMLKKDGKHDKIATESPDNVYVYPTPLTYLPVNLWYQHLGKHHYLALRRCLSRTPTEFDMVHSHFTWSAGYAGARIANDLCIPSVLTIHENEERLHEELSWDNSMVDWTLENTDALIRVNEKDCERLLEFNERVYSIPNGFDRDRFPLYEVADARNSLGLPENSKVIFSLGGLISRKRFDLLIDAVSGVDYDGDLICAIAGRGPLREDLEARIRRKALDIDVRILGYLSDEKLAKWMNACDIFALASESEGNPTVMFEALGCGKPYIGTDVGGVSEVINSDDYGLICPPASEEELTEILERALERSWNRDDILDYASNYTWEKIAKRVSAVYRDVLDVSEQSPRHLDSKTQSIKSE